MRTSYIFLLLILIVLYSHHNSFATTEKVCKEDLSKCINQTVILQGKISEVPWQHLIGSFKTHPYANYFDYSASQKLLQIVIYSKKDIKCTQSLRIKGQVVEIKGHSKRPSDHPEKYSELGVLILNWSCQK